jgi:hypothetical protein
MSFPLIEMISFALMVTSPALPFPPLEERMTPALSRLTRCPEMETLPLRPFPPVKILPR